MINKVYIASSSRFAEDCKLLAHQLDNRFNIKITRKWWDYLIKDQPKYMHLSTSLLYSQPIVQMIRELDFKAIRDADVVIVLCKEGHKPTGAMIEAGYAIRSNKIVIFFGEIKRCTMLSGCIHVNSKKELWELIKRDTPEIGDKE